MEYNPRDIEARWKHYWDEHQIYKVENGGNRPKYYVLDMFPYPSGAGLHVGHPLGYIATDIFSRYKRMKGFNVLHPMGFDAFGLPAEQYAIDTGIHPAISTAENVRRYRKQLDNIGFCYDWSREVNTSQPDYYRWTQWIFLRLFHHYYDLDANKALPIAHLEEILARQGNAYVRAACDDNTPHITADDWQAMSQTQRAEFLLHYRLTFPEESFVNWCPALRAVLSNDEVKDGVSERGGHPVERKRMKQWSMRITAYADRLLEGLDELDWPESLKEQQRNWIGRSQGASVRFALAEHDTHIEVFTTRLDTIFGVTFMVLAPEHELVAQITTPEQKAEVEAYVAWAASRSEVERMAEVKRVTGAFTGAYCINPFNQEKVPVYIADYVLAGYGTGAVMAVPSGDQRDWNFATHFGLPIVPILDAQKDLDKAADPTKEGRYINSGFINGLTYAEAMPKLVEWLESHYIGKAKVQYRMRNAIFSRQRYWGEPVPIYWKDGVPHPLDDSELPLILPDIDKYLPTDTGEPPLGRAEGWKYKGQYDYEWNTMPGWAGSSWYWYRYMDPQNDQAFASKEAIDYWRNVDVYVGGAEHAVGHLLYSRFWNHFLYDLGLVAECEYAKKLINQGMIQGIIEYLMLQKEKHNGVARFVSAEIAQVEQAQYGTEFARIPIHVDFVQDWGSPGSYLNIEGIKKFVDWRPDFQQAIFECSQGVYQNGVFTPKGAYADMRMVTVSEVGKMSKRYFNVVNPDDVVARYGADAFRMYEMFLGPLEDSKPWNTKGIDGVTKFLRRFWSLFFSENGPIALTEAEPRKEEWRVLHTAIKKVTEDIERFSFNTCVSAFMIAVNELKRLECRNRHILQPMVRLLAPFAPFISEELWHHLGQTGSVHHAEFPEYDETWLVEEEITYPISINGKLRATEKFPASAQPAELEQTVLQMDAVKRWLDGKPVRKVVIVPGRMINLVV